MCACDDRTDSQSGLSVEEGSHALYLPIEVAALFGSELIKRLHRDIKPAARAPLMPDSSDGSIDEEHRVVSRLPTRGQRALRGPPGKEQFARLAADGVGVEVGKQPNALKPTGRECRISSHHPCQAAVDLHWLKFTRESVEQFRRPTPWCVQPLREVLRRGWPVGIQIALEEPGEGSSSLNGSKSRQKPLRVGVGDFGASIGAEAQRTEKASLSQSHAPAGPHVVESRHDPLSGPGSGGGNHRFTQFVDGELGVEKRDGDGLDDLIGLLRSESYLFGMPVVGRRERRKHTNPQRKILRSEQVNRAAWAERFDQAVLGPQGISDLWHGEGGTSQPDGPEGSG